MMKTRRWRLLLLLLLLPGIACAAQFDLVAGVSGTDHQRTTPVVFASAWGSPHPWHDITFAPLATAGWLRARHTSKDELNHTVFVIAGGVRMRGVRWRHWFVSEQLAAVSARTFALSSRMQFITSVGWQAGHFILMARHISNGHLIGGGHNMGETMLLAGVAW